MNRRSRAGEPRTPATNRLLAAPLTVAFRLIRIDLAHSSEQLVIIAWSTNVALLRPVIVPRLSLRLWNLSSNSL